VILVDTSVWIDLFRQAVTPQARALQRLIPGDRIVVADLVMCDVLMGARHEDEAARIEADLRRFPIVEVSSAAIAVTAARNYRELRGLGVTVRSMADLLIGTWCIIYNHELLHRDRDFDAMERHLGLRVVQA
jgi:predicted nucleic acid-binding protein